MMMDIAFSCTYTSECKSNQACLPVIGSFDTINGTGVCTSSTNTVQTSSNMNQNDTLGTGICAIYKWIAGPVGRVLVMIILCFIGIAFFLSEIKLRTIGMFVIGVALLFGATTIIALISQSDNTKTGTINANRICF